MIILICILIGIIFAGTLYAFINKADSDSVASQQMTLTPMPETSEIQSLNKKDDTERSTYTGFGTIRAVTKIEEGEDFGSALVLTPWFSYIGNNTEFYEELSRKRVPLIGVFTSYFSSKTYNQFQKMSEEKIKADLLELINSQLSLGKIEQIYFTDFIFLN